MSKPTFVVSGASGQLGHRVVQLLLDAQAGHVIALTRSPAKIADLSAAGAEVRAADFDAPASLLAGFKGADRALLISTDALDRRASQHEAAIGAAARAGVQHVAYTSVVAADRGLPPAIAPSHLATEHALARSGMAITALRNSLYTDMFLQSLPRAIATGTLTAATGEQGAGYVTREDCARAAAAALISAGPAHRTIDITGPEVVTGPDLARIASEVSGRPVRFVPITPAQLRDGLVAAGMPPFVGDLLASFDDAIARGHFAVASDGVKALTGRAPQSVKAFLQAHLH